MNEQPAENATQPKVPPRVLRGELIRRDPLAADLQLGARPGGRPRGPLDLRRVRGSLPVLEAFQDFLEAERQRARQRLLMLASIFALILLAVIGTGLIVAIHNHGRVQRELGAVNRDVESLREATGHAVKLTGESLAALEATSGVLSRNMAQDHQSLEEIKAQVLNSNARYEALLLDMRKEFASLSHQNETLRKNISNVIGDMGRSVAPLSPGELPPGYDPVKSLRGQFRTFPSARHTTLALSVASTEEAEPLRWRLPIPE